MIVSNHDLLKENDKKINEAANSVIDIPVEKKEIECESNHDISKLNEVIIEKETITTLVNDNEKEETASDDTKTMNVETEPKNDGTNQIECGEVGEAKPLEHANEEPLVETETPKENMKLKEENSHFKQIVSDVIKSLPENGSIQSTSDSNKQPQEDFEQEAEIVSEETNDEKRNETAASSEGTNDNQTKIDEEGETSAPAASPSTNKDEASEEHMIGEITEEPDSGKESAELEGSDQNVEAEDFDLKANTEAQNTEDDLVITTENSETENTSAQDNVNNEEKVNLNLEETEKSMNDNDGQDVLDKNEEDSVLVKVNIQTIPLGSVSEKSNLEYEETETEVKENENEIESKNESEEEEKQQEI